MSHPRPFRFAVMATKATSGADRVETARKAEGLGSYVRVQGDAIDSFAPVVAKLAGS